MKIKKFKSNQILKLHLMNSRAYEFSEKNSNFNFLTESNLTHLICELKKVLYIIFQYHQAKKRILFIGVPSKLEFKINKLTEHLAVSESFDLQSIISNDVEFSKKSSSSYSKYLLPKSQKKPDLIALFTHEKQQYIINESRVGKIPLIIFDSGNNLSKSSTNSFYDLRGLGLNSKTKSSNNLFFVGLNFLFKTSRKKVSEGTFNSKVSSVRKRFREYTHKKY